MSTATVARSSRRKSAIRTSAASAGHSILESGYHLSRSEFHRRYQLLPPSQKAELIEGVVVMASPVRYEHAEATRIIAGWQFNYVVGTPGVRGLENATVLLDADNEVQPDAILLVDPNQGGQTRLSKDNYVEGAPELIVEVALSSVAHDLHEKLKVYQRNCVLEYIVWQLQERRIDWFIFNRGQYIPLRPTASGVFRSRVFPGLWLDSAALLIGNLKQLMRCLDKGLRSSEHQKLVKKLQPN
jgi:Uma2 family endonuclease